MKIEIEVSVGELYDKISILRIKKNKILNPDKLFNINKELIYLENKMLNNDPVIQNLADELFQINSKLWDIENEKRLCEKNSDFGDVFIKTSRDIHFLNDKRGNIKLEINNHTGSKIKEIKEYTGY